MTLPGGALSVDADFGVAHVDLGDLGDETFVGAGLGASYGVIDDLQVFATVLPLELSPDFDYGDPSLGAIFRFLRGDVEMGAGLALALPNFGDPVGRKFSLNLAVPVLIRLGDMARLDVALSFLSIFFEEPEYHFVLPLALTLQATDNFFLGLRTGLGWEKLQLGDTSYKPLGFFAGFTIARQDRRPIADLIASFDFPLLFTWGKEFGDTVTTEFWTIGLSARVHFDLAGGGEETTEAPPATP